MSKQANPDFFTSLQDFLPEADRRFPISGQAGQIFGNGRYVLVSKCFRRWKVLLYRDKEARDARLTEWERTYCPANMDCRGNHETCELDDR